MISYLQLLITLRDGKIGELLARTFRGKRTILRPTSLNLADAEASIELKPGEEVTKDAVERAVRDFLEERGYKVTLIPESARGILELKIECPLVSEENKILPFCIIITLPNTDPNSAPNTMYIRTHSSEF